MFHRNKRIITYYIGLEYSD